MKAITDESVEVIVARMDERQKSLAEDVKELKDSVENHVEALQKDVNTLKLWRAKVAGIAMGLSAITGGVTALIFTLIVRALGV